MDTPPFLCLKEDVRGFEPRDSLFFSQILPVSDPYGGPEVQKNMKPNQITQTQIRKQEHKSKNTNTSRKTRMQIKKHERKSEKTNARNDVRSR